jgi:hypothetical protein
MFDVSISNIGINGFTNMLMTSEMTTNELIAEFKAAIDEGYDLDLLFELNNVDEFDIVETDKQRLVNEVSKYARSKFYGTI